MWQWIKFPKIGALACFILPWMTVSCAGREVASATGFGLAFGHISFALGAPDQQSASINLWLILAMIAIAGGIYLAVRGGRERARALAATSGAALLLILVGTHGYSRDAFVEQAMKGDDGLNASQASALAALQVDWHIGYWLTILFLIAALVMAVLVVLGKDDEAEARIRTMAADVSGAARDVANKAEEAVSAGAAQVKDAVRPDAPPADPAPPPPEAGPPSGPDDPGPR